METLNNPRPPTYLKLKWLLTLKLRRLIELLEQEDETADFAAPFKKLLMALNRPLTREDFQLVARAVREEVGCARTVDLEFTQLAYLLTDEQDADPVWNDIELLVIDVTHRDHSWDQTLPPSPLS